jgi:hypothetical protein
VAHTEDETDEADGSDSAEADESNAVEETADSNGHERSPLYVAQQKAPSGMLQKRSC